MSIASRALLLASALSLSLAACSSTLAGADDPAPTAPDAMAGCDAAAAQSAVGQQATPEAVEQARKDAGAKIARVLKPGQVVTMEYNGGRLNLHVDAQNAITSATCG